MTVSTINSGSLNIADLINRQRQAMAAMAASVQSGDLTGAQQSLATAQRYTSSIEAATSSSTQATNPYRSTLSTDLTGLLSAPSENLSQQAVDALFASNETATNGALGTDPSSTSANLLSQRYDE